MKRKNAILPLAAAITLALFFSPLLQAVEKVDKEKILAEREWYTLYNDHITDLSYLEALRSKIGSNLKIDVYLGLWCSDSRNNVPPFMKILDDINKKEVEVNYYTVERKAGKDVKYFVEDLKIERVPTFIFYRDGKEIGRIVENPSNSLTEDFLDIIF